MFLAKLTLMGGESADHAYYVKSVKEIHEFVSAQFNDNPNMPQDIQQMNIQMVSELIEVNGNYIPNPEYVANIG